MRFEDWLKAFPHTTHLCGFSPGKKREEKSQVFFGYNIILGVVVTTVVRSLGGRSRPVIKKLFLAAAGDFYGAIYLEIVD